MRLLITIVTILSFTTACSSNMNSKRVTPESLLNSSSERVAFSLLDESSLIQIKEWASEDKPTSADIACNNEYSKICKDAQKLLFKENISYSLTPSNNGSNSIALIYKRVTAHDCDGKNLGCGVSVNTLQMIADHDQILDPSLSDEQSADNAVLNYKKYINK